jgi:hypothetical protein
VISAPSLQKDFGHLFENKYIISASWQIAFNTSCSTGDLFGAIASRYLTDDWGMILTLGLGYILSIGAVLMQVFAAQPGDRNGILFFIYSSLDFN